MFWKDSPKIAGILAAIFFLLGIGFTEVEETVLSVFPAWFDFSYVFGGLLISALYFLSHFCFLKFRRKTALSDELKNAPTFRLKRSIYFAFFAFLLILLTYFLFERVHGYEVITNLSSLLWLPLHVYQASLMLAFSLIFPFFVFKNLGAETPFFRCIVDAVDLAVNCTIGFVISICLMVMLSLFYVKEQMPDAISTFVFVLFLVFVGVRCRHYFVSTFGLIRNFHENFQKVR